MTTCKQCKSPFEVTDQDRQFYKKIDVPEPTLCPDCRQQRRLSWRNERQMYRHLCKLCKKNIVSLYPPDSPYTVYCQNCWWGDQWNPLEYGQKFNFSRPFFEQYRELQLKVPRLSLFNMNSENSEYTNHSADNKNCYMSVAIGQSEDCMYGHWIINSKDVIDALYCDKCEQCYECIYCVNCYETFYSEFCENLKNCWMCFECKGCEYCIACTQLQHKKFYILNKSVSEKEFHNIKNEMLKKPSKFRKIFEQYQNLKRAETPRRATRQINCINCTGSDLINCKNAKFCFNCHNLEDCKYVFDGADIKDSMDTYEHGWYFPSELIYDTHAGRGGHYFRFCNLCADSRNLTYCDYCFNNSADLFGCISLKHKQYCILNKQYTKEEYEALVYKIIEYMSSTGEWGEFFPSSLSPFPYNHSPGMEYYPLSKEEVNKRGWHWLEEKKVIPEVDRIIPASKLPDSIKNVDDDILNWAIECEATGRPFKIIPQELKFYRTHQIPIPHFHPDERHKHRMELRSPRKLYDRKCNQCQIPIQTTYAPDRPEKVYCESCYLKEVY